MMGSSAVGAMKSVVAATQGAADGPDTWIVALVGAVVGALITVLVERALNRRAEQRRLNGLMRSLLLEVETIGGVAKERAETPASVGIPRHAPLPTQSWELLLASGLVDKVDRATLESLRALYREAQEANYLASLAPTYLLIANTGRESAAQSYIEQAQQVATEPFGPIAATARDAQARLG